MTIFSLISGGGGTVVYQIDDGVLGVGGIKSSCFVRLTDIISAELEKTFEAGESTGGEVSKDVYSGIFRNADYGEYELYAYANSEACIVVRHKDGTLVFGDKDADATEKFFEQLKEAMTN